MVTYMGRRRDSVTSMTEMMKALALNGPSTKWDLSSKSSGKAKDCSTSLSYSLVLRYLKRLMRMGYVKEYGIRKKTKKSVGHPVAGKSNKIKHETMLYGLTWFGLWSIFMEDQVVRNRLDTVENNYPELKPNTWLEVTKGWINDSRLSRTFPLLKQYGRTTRHYEPNARLFVQALVLTTVYLREGKLAEGYDHAVEFFKRYPKGAIIRLWWGLEREIKEHEEIVKRCKTLMEKLKPLRYSSNDTETTN